MFSSLLVANRGEIACRIFRTARRMGIRTVAVFSEADRDALHVREADEAFPIGPAQVRESYLNVERILDVAKRAKVPAIHPGYGFLSENAGFAEACAKLAITFVGPSPAAMLAMGLKDRAKDVAARAGVPVIPGFRGAEQSDGHLEKEASRVGFPLIIKAVAGGGGKGMRVVKEGADFLESLHACRREASSSFGDERVLLERFFPASRHIEVQVMGDNFGHVVHLFERDCSIQRRHQKVIEEAPAFGLSQKSRQKMHEAAVAIAKTVNYAGAGTIEFLYDPTSDQFYFMEMNTRLQVEHPVSEMITGLDFVELQLRVAAGEKLPLAQSEIRAAGHAVEARLYAEDPTQGFLPQTGQLELLKWPSAAADFRVETGVEQGNSITAYYDPMIAKLIVHREERESALEGLAEALQQTTIFGIKTNKGFLQRLLRSKPLKTTVPNTRFIEEHAAEAVQSPPVLPILGIVAWLENSRAPLSGPWRSANGWTLGGDEQVQLLKLNLQGVPHDVRLRYRDCGIEIRVDDKSYLVSAARREGEMLTVDIEGVTLRGKMSSRAGNRNVYADLDGFQFSVGEPDYSVLPTSAGAGSGLLRAPMPGRVLKIEITNGAHAQLGQRLFVLEAMKMEHVLRAPLGGLVKEIAIKEGDQVKEGDFLCLIEAA